METNIPSILQIINSTFNVDISLFDMTFIQKIIQKRTQNLNVVFIDDYSKYLENNIDEQIILYHSLHNHYTEFFRNTLCFDVLKQIIFPMLVKKHNSEINIWMPTCSSGQEAYSMAIIIDEFHESLNKTNQFKIYASDICEEEINNAIEGSYSLSSLSKVTINQFEKYFSNEKDHTSVKTKLKSKVQFSIFDLLSNDIPKWNGNVIEKFDIIMCSNMLFYYSESGRKKIINKIESYLKKDGILIVGEVERDILLKENYIELFFHSAIFAKTHLF